MKIPDAFYTRAEFPQVLDSTMLSASPCPTKFFYQYCMNLSGVEKSIHLHAGGMFAHSLEHIRKAFYVDLLPLNECILIGFREACNYWGDYDNVPMAGTGQYKDFVNMFAAVIDYFGNYHPETDYIQPYIKSDGKPAVEFTFSIPLPIMHPVTGEPLIYAGRCDMVGVYNGVNVCIVDEKTTYSFMPDWAKMFNMRGQFIGYTFAAQYYDMPVDMCVIRGIGIQQKSIKHLEAIIQYPQWQIDRWFQEAMMKVENLVNCWNEREFPLNYGDICSSYGGCPMMDLCTSHQPEVWIDSYSVHKWNPLDKKEGSL